MTDSRKKTPMQQMHEFLCEELAKKDSWRDYPHIENAILKCEELIEKERDEIEEAFEEGHLTAHWHGCPASFVIPGSVYYDKLYTDFRKDEENDTGTNRGHE